VVEPMCSVENTNNLIADVESGKYPADTAYGKFLFQSSRFNDQPLEECAQTIKSTKVDCGVITQLRIRKLTPKECWRLMGFDDADFEKAAAVNSNSQLYKQAGNSIVVDVLCYIFGMML
jgi:DNA (cytosine-5)-methyltransferase 1